MCELGPERVGAPLLPRAGILDTRHSAHAGSGRFQAAPAQTMLQILSHTPRWVFALFAALLAFGLLQTKSRKVNATLAYVLPAGLVVLSLSGIQSSFGFRPSPLAAWAVGLTATAVIGYKVFPNKRILFNSETATFYVPGSWAPLAVIMAIFFTKYAFAVMQGFGVAAAGSPVTAVALSLAYGCLSGYFVARAASLMAAARPKQSAA